MHSLAMTEKINFYKKKKPCTSRPPEANFRYRARPAVRLDVSEESGEAAQGGGPTRRSVQRPLSRPGGTTIMTTVCLAGGGSAGGAGRGRISSPSRSRGHNGSFSGIGFPKRSWHSSQSLSLGLINTSFSRFRAFWPLWPYRFPIFAG